MYENVRVLIHIFNNITYIQQQQNININKGNTIVLTVMLLYNCDLTAI
jgi:hypothetical protein